MLDLRLHRRVHIQWLESAVSAARQLKDRRGEGADLGNLGLAYAALGETRKAIGYYEQGLVIAREIGDRRGEGDALGNLGLAYAALGETRKAIGYYEEQLIIVREIGDRRGEGNALWNMALARRKLGESADAVPLAEEALQICGRLKIRMPGRSSGNWRSGGEESDAGLRRSLPWAVRGEDRLRGRERERWGGGKIQNADSKVQRAKLKSRSSTSTNTITSRSTKG